MNNDNTKILSKQDRIKMASDFLQKLFGNLPKDKFFTYLWVLSPDKKVKRTVPFAVNGDFEPVAQKAIQLNDEGNHVFFGVNLTDSPMDEYHRATEKDIRLQTAIITDIDIQCSWHVGRKYPANFEQAKSFLPFEPSILVDSAGGIHAYNLLKNPLCFTSDEERKQALSRNKDYIEIIRQNAGEFANAVDGVHDLPRVLRLPGTYNLKNGRENAPLCRVVHFGSAYTLENLHKRIKSSPITPKKNNPVESKNTAETIINNLTEQERAVKMLESFSPTSLSYDEWLQVGMGLKSNGNSCTDWERWSSTDSARFKEGECEKKWLGFDRNDITIATVHFFAKKYGNYSEKACQSERHEENKKFALEKFFQSDEELVEKILDWQKLKGEIDPAVLEFLKNDAKTYLEKIKVENFSAGICFSSRTQHAVASCLFYDFYSDVAQDFLTRMKNAIHFAKEKVKSETADNPVADSTKSLSAIRPSDFEKSVSKFLTEIKNRHKLHLFKLHDEKALERREQYEKNPVTTRTTCPDCPVDLALPFQTKFEKSGIFAYDESQRLKCICKTPIIPTRQFVNPSEGTYHYELAINTNANEWRKIICDAETLFNSRSVLGLVDSGARFSSKTAVDLSEWFVQVLSVPENQELIQRVEIYNQPGWVDDECREFIYPQNEEKYLVRTKNFDYEKAFAKRGDKTEWLEMFKKVLGKSSVARLTLGASFSAPLINILNVRNLQVHLSCPSGSGKSSLIKFCMSAYGNPERFKFKFNATTNALETQAFLFNDLPSWLEELQSANKKQRENIDQIVYDYESGVSRGRNTKQNFLQKQKYFRGCRLSTGEQNLTNQFSGEGAISRILEISRSNIFGNDFAIEVHQFCAENFGHFGQDWINFVAENKNEIRRCFADFEKKFRASGLMSNHVTTISASYTALLFFAKMIGLDVEELEEILYKDFLSFAGELPTKDHAKNSSRALQTIAETVASHPKFFKAEKYDSNEDDFKLGNSEEGSALFDYGFVLRNGDVCIYPSALREILKDYPSVDALIRNFAECGYLDCGTNEKRPYQKQVKYNGTPRWIYRFKKMELDKS